MRGQHRGVETRSEGHDMSSLIATAQALMAPDKGLLAMDESVKTCHRRLAGFGISQTEESRRRYRDLLVTTPGLSESISGAILFRRTRAGTSGATVAPVANRQPTSAPGPTG